MFDSYEFTFAGESSAMYGVMLYEFGGTGQSPVSFGNRASIVEDRTMGRIKPLHFGVNYHGKPLEFKLVFGALEPIDRYQMEDIAMWLTGHQDYQWLTIDQPDLERVAYRCLITELKPLHHGWLPVAFEASVVCDCPYAYGLPFRYQYQLSGEADVLIRNDGSAREYVRPTLLYQPLEGGELRIVNHSDGGREFRLGSLPTGALSIVIDNENEIIRETTAGYNLYVGFNLNFFRLAQGDNRLTLSGAGALSIEGRALYNTGG